MTKKNRLTKISESFFFFFDGIKETRHTLLQYINLYSAHTYSRVRSLQYVLRVVRQIHHYGMRFSINSTDVRVVYFVHRNDIHWIGCYQNRSSKTRHILRRSAFRRRDTLSDEHRFVFRSFFKPVNSMCTRIRPLFAFLCKSFFQIKYNFFQLHLKKMYTYIYFFLSVKPFYDPYGATSEIRRIVVRVMYTVKSNFFSNISVLLYVFSCGVGTGNEFSNDFFFFLNQRLIRYEQPIVPDTIKTYDYYCW